MTWCTSGLAPMGPRSNCSRVATRVVITRSISRPTSQATSLIFRRNSRYGFYLDKNVQIRFEGGVSARSRTVDPQVQHRADLPQPPLERDRNLTIYLR